MKKFIWPIISIIFILGNYLGFLTLEASLTVKTLYKNVSQVEIKSESNYNQNKLLDSIKTFSMKNNTNIMQYTFVGEKAINIYASNIEDSSTFHISQKPSSQKNKYLSNKAGLDFPHHKWDIKIYSFDQVHNVSLGTLFYVEGLDNPVIYKAFTDEFKQFGDLSFKQLHFSTFNFIDASLLSILLLFLYIYIIMSYYYVKQEQRLFIKQLWGYSNWEILKSLLHHFLKCIFIAIPLLLYMVVFLFLQGIQFYFIPFLATLIGVNVLLFLFITITIYLFGHRELKKKEGSFSSIKRQTTKQQLLFNLVTKFILAFSLTLLFVTFFKSYLTLSGEMKNFATWNDVNTVHKVQVGLISEDVQDDLKKDAVLNNKFSAFYEQAKETKNAFIMDSTNFQRIENNQFQYLKLIQSKNDILSPQGRSVKIDANYLRLNPIRAIEWSK
ncbi:hypothetical protein [Listeria fleischmannii]|uniref:hypothetical protein n=1 Tax=Listeria fleischmannii TaxID=1069827 RepID=UPI0002BAF0E9|nr:hypothetical protein [Listeria fleischmannii]EMG26973.1 hypothetical protein LFLEISCH_13682 [Listeria fleischmannii subsp. fleischmannii LU2006-1]